MTQDWTVKMGMPEGSVQLPVGETRDLKTWAVSAARDRLRGVGASEVQMAAFTNVLMEAAADAAQRNPVIAFAFCPDPAAGELARIEVRVLDAGAGVGVGADDDDAGAGAGTGTGTGAGGKASGGVTTVRDLAAFYGTRTPLTVQDPDVRFVTLPAGPAARVLHEYAAESGPVQTFLHAVCPPGLDVGVVMFMSWQVLYYSDRLIELGDDLAETLRIVEPQ